MFSLTTCIQHWAGLEVLPSSIRKLENSQLSKKTVVELISEFGKVIGYKINIQKLIIVTYFYVKYWAFK